MSNYWSKSSQDRRCQLCCQPLQAQICSFRSIVGRQILHWLAHLLAIKHQLSRNWSFVGLLGAQFLHYPWPDTHGLTPVAWHRPTAQSVASLPEAEKSGPVILSFSLPGQKTSYGALWRAEPETGYGFSHTGSSDWRSENRGLNPKTMCADVPNSHAPNWCHWHDAGCLVIP